MTVHHAAAAAHQQQPISRQPSIPVLPCAMRCRQTLVDPCVSWGILPRVPRFSKGAAGEGGRRYLVEWNERCRTQNVPEMSSEVPRRDGEKLSEVECLMCGLLFMGLFFRTTMLFSSWCLTAISIIFSGDRWSTGGCRNTRTVWYVLLLRCAGNKRHVAHGSTETPRCQRDCGMRDHRD